MQEIHNLIISLNFNEIEVKTANSLESLDGRVLVMVTGLVQVKDFICRRKFVESFFLAPQEKGYFVLNDIFLLLEEEQVLPHSVATLSHDDYDTNLDTLNHMEEPGMLNQVIFSQIIFLIKIVNFLIECLILNDQGLLLTNLFYLQIFYSL